MDKAEIDNWKTIAESMEAKGDTDSWFSVALAPLPMASQTQCPTCQNLWEAVLPNDMSRGRGRGNPRIPTPKALAVVLRQVNHHLVPNGPQQGPLRLNT